MEHTITRLTILETKFQAALDDARKTWDRLLDIAEEIKAKKLYADAYDSFEDYLQRRWNTSKGWYYKMRKVREAQLPDEIWQISLGAQVEISSITDDSVRAEVIEQVQGDVLEAETVSVKRVREFVATASINLEQKLAPSMAIFSEIEAYATKISSNIRRLQYTDGGEYVAPVADQLCAQVRQLQQTIQDYRPAKSCVTCEGQGCPRCDNYGWTPGFHKD